MIEKLQKEIDLGRSRFEIIAQISSYSVSILDAMKMIRTLYEVNLGDAKGIVSSHPSYVKLASVSLPMQNEIAEGFERLAGMSDEIPGSCDEEVT